jgi:release factor glutamine methyltransferase
MFAPDPMASHKIALVLHANYREKEQYEVRISDIPFVVHPRVFSPKYCADTAFFAENIPVVKGNAVLEIGCGTGIISIFALFKGARSVVAVDINPLAIKNSIENACRHNLIDKIDVRLGDVYEPLRPDERFDLVFWNIPFGFLDRDEISIDEKALFDPGYQAFKRYIGGSADHLKENGRLLFGCCPELARFDLISELLRQSGFSQSTVASTKVTYLNEMITFQLLDVQKL